MFLKRSNANAKANQLNKNCWGAHGLQKFNTPNDRFTCDGCDEYMSKNDVMHGCRVCNYDLCSDCYFGSQNSQEKDKNCSGAHGLKQFNVPNHRFTCDGCNEAMSKNDAMYGCRVCNYDLCSDCYSDSDNDEKKQAQRTQVKFEVNKTGSVTFYPTPNIERGTQKFKTKLFVKSSKCPASFEGVFDYKKEIVEDYEASSLTKNSFINCAELAYAKHYPFLIKPEHIFLLIMQAVSIHVDKNAEKLRSKYVNHSEGKKRLTVILNKYNFVRKSPNNDWNGIISDFCHQIDKNTKKDVVPLFTSDFSSSTLTEKIAAKITLMSTCKNYFKYEMMNFSCGYPEITLEGNIDDWILLKKKVKKVLSRKVTKRFGEKWKVSLLPVLDRFIAAFKGEISMVFWNSMICKGQWAHMETGDFYSGGGRFKAHSRFISGWLNVFFPYIGDDNLENKYCFEVYSGDNNAQKQYKGYKHESHANNELWKPLGPGLGDFNDGIAEAPVLYVDEVENVSLEVKMKAGFMGFEQDSETLRLSTTVGWYIDEDKKKSPY